MPTQSREGAQRAATAAIYANGGFSVVLRMPGNASSGNDGEQLGLGVPHFNDVPIGPAVWKRAGSQLRLLIGAEAVAAQVASDGLVSARQTFEAAAFVLVDDMPYVISGCDPVMVAGSPCAYLLSLEAPTWT